MARSSSRAPARGVIIARNSLWLTVDGVVAIGATVISSVAVARVLGPERLGYYAYVLWVASLGAALTTSGIGAGTQKFAAQLLGGGHVSSALRLLYRALALQAVTAAGLVGAGLALVFTIVPAEHRDYATLAVVSLAPLLLLSVLSAGIIAAQRLEANVLPSLAGTSVNLALVFLALWRRWDLVGLTAALLVSRTIDCVLRYVSFRAVFRELLARERPVSPDAAPLPTIRLGQFAWQATGLLILDMIVWDRSEMFFLKHYSPVAEVAFFSLSFNIVQQSMFVPRLFAVSSAPSIQAEVGRVSGDVNALTSTVIRYLSLVALPASFGLAALSDALIRLLYGSKYLAAIPVLALVAGLYVGRSFVQPIRDLVRTQERQDFLLLFGLAAAAVNICLDLALIPRGGAIGAAWANGLAQTFAAAGIVAFAVRRLGLEVPWSAVIRTFAASVLMAAIVWGLCRGLPPLVGLLAGVLVGLPAYVLGLRLFRPLEPDDRIRLRFLETHLPGTLTRSYRRVVDFVVPVAVS